MSDRAEEQGGSARDAGPSAGRAPAAIRLTLEARGIVQGVGFRPFVAREARALGLRGTVCNTAYGARVEAEGPRAACEALAARIEQSPPPGAVIFSLDRREETPRGETEFRILSSGEGAPDAAVSPDLGVCDACVRELFDPHDRRYRYPFLNCTACGPRFTILERVPYDRAHTTMKAFPMCADCAREYHDPENRRFHAQPTACPVCGPRLIWLEGGAERPGDPVARFVAAMRAGQIVAVKGLGGFHLACDAGSDAAVARLRLLKQRYEKPLAVMVRDLAEAERLCVLAEAERAELCSPRKPIVLLKKRPGCAVADAVAPGNDRLGVMLPYTPLHLLLTEHCPVLVMTSGNVSDAPMRYRDGDEAALRPLCDAVLTHNRPILRRMDDSVCFFAAGGRRLIRRARGFAPQPVPVRAAGTEDAPHILAFGAQLKNVFCLMKDGRAYLSGHVGDLDDAETCAFCEQEIPRFLGLFGGRPALIAHDLHPDYMSTRLARAFAAAHPEAALVGVQHHHAHFASVLAEHGLRSAVGLIFDGTGFGTDGTIWGGELLCGTVADSERLGRLRPLPLVGGDAAVRAPWRVGLCAAAEAVGAERALRLFAGCPDAEKVLALRDKAAFAPRSSGMGRLFDAAAAICGLRRTVSYEGQAAVQLEQAFDPAAAGAYRFEIAADGAGLTEFDWRPVLRALIADLERGEPAGAVSARFHRAVAALVRDAAALVPGEPVALSGGVFQNARLLALCTEALRARKVYLNGQVPANDGGICYGQAAAAAARWKGV